jgi:hypothetical protein
MWGYANAAARLQSWIGKYDAVSEFLAVESGQLHAQVDTYMAMASDHMLESWLVDKRHQVRPQRDGPTLHIASDVMAKSHVRES